MNPGKEICKELKELRKQIAEENGTLSMVFIKVCFAVVVMCYFVGMISCRSGVQTDNAVAQTDDIPDISSESVPEKSLDTLWSGDRSYWEIKQQYEENGRTVLYRSCTFGDMEDDDIEESILSYYLLSRGTAAYNNCLRTMQTGSAADCPEMLEESDDMIPVRLGDMPRRWYTVRKYHGKPYLFRECVFSGKYLSDVAFVETGCDCWSYTLKGVEKTADGSFKFLFVDKDTVVTAKMELVDKDNGLFRYSGNGGGLFTTDSHVRNYDIIMMEGYPVASVDNMKFDK